MTLRYECRVATRAFARDIRRMAEAGWRFVWAGHYDLMPYIVFEREVKAKKTRR